MGMIGQRHAQGKGPSVLIVQEAVWALEDTEARGKSACLCRGSNVDCPVVQFLARHYTDRATRLKLSLTYFPKLNVGLSF
jgi:hypothetical protein